VLSVCHDGKFHDCVQPLCEAFPPLTTVQEAFESENVCAPQLHQLPPCSCNARHVWLGPEFIAFWSRVVPDIVVIFTLVSDINSFIEGKTQIINSVFGLFLVAIGIPFYLYFNKYKTKEV